MDEMYHGTAKLKDGRVIEVDGSLMSCSNWADNVIRSEGDCQISVIRIDEPEAGGRKHGRTVLC